MCMSYEVKVWNSGIIQFQAFRLDRALGKFKRMIRGLNYIGLSDLRGKIKSDNIIN